MTSRNLSEHIKKSVAYTQAYKCSICTKLLPSSYQIDHKIPWSITEDNSIENLQALCSNCHSIKTQRENLRIIQFSRLQRNSGCKICWYCLAPIKINHICNKTVTDITEYVRNIENNATKFDDMISKYKLCTINDTKLTIEILFYNFTIYVTFDNTKTIYKCPNSDITIENVVEAVDVATRSKKYSNKFDTVEIKLIHKIDKEIGDTENEACLEFLNDNLLDLLPQRIFQDVVTILE